MQLQSEVPVMNTHASNVGSQVHRTWKKYKETCLDVQAMPLDFKVMLFREIRQHTHVIRMPLVSTMQYPIAEV